MSFILIINGVGSCNYEEVWQILNNYFDGDVVKDIVIFEHNWQVTFKKVNSLIAEFIVKSITRIEYAPGLFWQVDIQETCQQYVPLIPVLILKNAVGTCFYDDIWQILNDYFKEDVVDHVFTIGLNWEVFLKKNTETVENFILYHGPLLEYAPNKFWDVDNKEYPLSPPLDRGLAKIEIQRKIERDALGIILPPPIMGRQITQDYVPYPDCYYRSNKQAQYQREMALYKIEP